MSLDIVLRNENFTLHSSASVFWEKQSTLIISDVHLGKIAHFRKHGMAVPQKAAHANFKALDDVVAQFDPERIIFLGDLFHSYINKEWLLFEQWIASKTQKFILVSGNHDIIPPLNYTAIGIDVVPELVIDDFLFTHHPVERNGYFNFCGHIHPAIRIYGIGRQNVRLACFYRTPHQIILPAFGEFTGTHILKPSTNGEVYAILGDSVLQVPAK